MFPIWLNRLDDYVGRTKGRKILVIIDIRSAHGTPETLQPLQSIRVEFLPPSTTGCVQPLDAGIIAWLKVSYKKRFLFRTFDSIDMERKSIYNTEILTAMRWMSEEWEACSARMIADCFTHRLNAEVGKSDEERVINNENTLENMV